VVPIGTEGVLRGERTRASCISKRSIRIRFSLRRLGIPGPGCRGGSLSSFIGTAGTLGEERVRGPGRAVAQDLEGPDPLRSQTKGGRATKWVGRGKDRGCRGPHEARISPGK
jgi:hypothetical protein